MSFPPARESISIVSCIWLKTGNDFPYFLLRKIPPNIIDNPIIIKIMGQIISNFQLFSQTSPIHRKIKPGIRPPAMLRRWAGITIRNNAANNIITPAPVKMSAQEFHQVGKVSVPQLVVAASSTRPAQMNIAAQEAVLIGSRCHFSSQPWSCRPFSSFSSVFSSSFSLW